MNAFRYLFCLAAFASLLAGCASDTKKTETTNTLPLAVKIVTGDFNGDGKPDTVRLIKPELNKDGTACVDSACIAFIRFSDTSIHSISVKHCIGGTLDNLGDLNGDHRDELGILPDWFTSCWHEYLVYSYKNNEWMKPVDPIITHCNQWEANVKPIEKDSLNKGYVVVRYSEMVGDSIKTKSKIVSIK